MHEQPVEKYAACERAGREEEFFPFSRVGRQAGNEKVDTRRDAAHFSFGRNTRREIRRGIFP